MNPLSAKGYDTDKSPDYIRLFEMFLSPYRHRPVNLLELGVNRGGSLRMWRDYFPNGQMFGVDLKPPTIPDSQRIHLFAGDAASAVTYEHIERATGVAMFDIVIDDASHCGIPTKQSFDLLFTQRLSPGGLYVIEDWGTGYFDTWPDGKALRGEANPKKAGRQRVRFPSHDYGLPGHIKQLVDNVAHVDVLKGGGQIIDLRIDTMTVAPGLTFVKKLP